VPPKSYSSARHMTAVLADGERKQPATRQRGDLYADHV
jgi:hypothetical protein